MEVREIAWDLLKTVNQIILGKAKQTREILAAMLAGGHVMLEDIPGVGKTTLAVTFSELLGFQWNRVQFTPDVLPSDLTGFSIYRRDTQRFEYQEGAVFCNLLLADELNRTSPKTQSALLEVMEEQQVTVDRETRKVPSPFFVIATQNPSGAAGTQPLPPAQIDRFMVSMSLGYPDLENEIAMAKGETVRKNKGKIQQKADIPAFREMQQQAEQVYIDDDLYEYIVKLISATRESPYLEYGASPRGTIALVRMAKAAAWLRGRDFVVPEDVKEQFPYVVRHRMILNGKARIDGISKEQMMTSVLQSIRMPEIGRKR